MTTPAESRSSDVSKQAALCHLGAERLEVALADAVVLRLRRIFGARRRRLAFDAERHAPADFERQEVAAADRMHAGLLPDLLDDRGVRLRHHAPVTSNCLPASCTVVVTT